MCKIDYFNRPTSEIAPKDNREMSGNEYCSIKPEATYITAKMSFERLAIDAAKAASAPLLQHLLKHRALKEFSIVAREALARELRLAYEVLLLSTNDDSSNEISAEMADLLDLKAFDSICNCGYPLSRLLPDELCKNAKDKLEANAQHKHYARDLSHQYLLIERTYFRLKVFQTRCNAGADIGNIGYVKALILASLESLKSSSNTRAKTSFFSF